MSGGEGSEDQTDLRVDPPPSPNISREGQPSEEETESGDADMEEETEALEPLEMHFKHSEYEKVIKIQSRCYIKEAVGKIDELLNGNEKKWFLSHPQFKHFFHMHLEKKNKLMGMWMLLLHTASLSKKREAWFIINGVPIRYSIKEHGLISGLYCHNYPLGWEKMGGLDFVARNFKRGSTISYEAIKEKFFGMRPCKDRLKMAVLYFLSSVLIGKPKKGEKGTGKGATSVEPFFLRAVNDLSLCETFPWGRLTFDDNMTQMKNLFHSCRRVVDKSGWCYPSFHIPLQLLAFETIKVLKMKYRENVEDVGSSSGSSCPRMCTTKFTKHAMTGFPLSELYETLGTSKEIDSIFVPTPSENAFSAEIFDEEENIRDEDDYIVQSWERRLLIDRKPIFLSTSFDFDVNGPQHKCSGPKDAGRVDADAVVSSDDVSNLRKSMSEVKEGMSELVKTMEDGFKTMMDKMVGQDARLKVVEELLKSQRWNDRTEISDDVGGNMFGDGGGNLFGDDVGEKDGGGAREEQVSGGGGDGGKEEVGGGDGGKEDVGGGSGGEEEVGGGDGVEEEVDGGDVPKGRESGVDKEGDEEGEKGDEEEGEREEKEIVGEKRKKKPSVKCKTPYTTMKSQKRRKKKKSSS